jgi:hypothetical protein
MRATHGPTMARRERTLLRGALQLAVLHNVLGTNPVRDVQSIRSKATPMGATALTADQLGELLANSGPRRRAASVIWSTRSRC